MSLIITKYSRLSRALLNAILHKSSITDSTKACFLTLCVQNAFNYKDSYCNQDFKASIAEGYVAYILEQPKGVKRELTEHSSPLNTSLILEYLLGQNKTPVFITFSRC